MDFSFAQALHDRAGNRRLDDEWKKDPTLRVLVVGGEYVGTVDGPGLLWLDPTDAPQGEWILLGEGQDGALRGAVRVGHVEADFDPLSMRMLGPMLGDEDASWAIHAVAISRWQQSHTYCSRCGDYLFSLRGGHLLVCPNCNVEHFPRCDPAAIMLITDERDRALLARNVGWPENRFSTLAGFVEPGESVEDALRREVHEEVGVTVGDVRYAGSQPWPFPSSLMLGFFGSALTTDIHTDDDEIAEADWFSRDELTRYLDGGKIVLPPSKVSISRFLIDSWLTAQG